MAVRIAAYIGGTMFKRIIVATDLSPASLAVANCLGGLKAYGAKHCLLMQCLSLQEAASVGLSYSSEILHEALREQKEAIEKQGFTVETRIVPGFAMQELNRAALEENYQLIVVGTIKRSLTSEAFMGGITADIIHSAKTPVLILRIEAKSGEVRQCHKAGPCDFSRHVLCPTDFSENADNAFVYVEKLAAAGAKNITLIHVQDKSKIDPHLKSRLEEFNRIDRERLEELKGKLAKKGKAEIKIALAYGSPAVEIMKFALEKKPDLIVMGSQGRGFVKELFLGSVSQNVARHADADVLLVPANR